MIRTRQAQTPGLRNGPMFESGRFPLFVLAAGPDRRFPFLATGAGEIFRTGRLDFQVKNVKLP